jgi:hypothetical protein
MPQPNLSYVRKDTIIHADKQYQYYRDFPVTRELADSLPMLNHFGIELVGIDDLFDDVETMYKIQTRQLYLTSMTILGTMKRPYQKISGVEPAAYGKYNTMRYEGLLERIPFTGTIVMGLPYIARIQGIFDYKTVKVVNCIRGEVKEIEDLSTYIQNIKDEIQEIEQEYQHEKATRNRYSGKLKRMYSSRIQKVYRNLGYKLHGFHRN